MLILGVQACTRYHFKDFLIKLFKKNTIMSTAFKNETVLLKYWYTKILYKNIIYYFT